MNQANMQAAGVAQEDWLKRYYFARAGFSIAWIAAVLGLVPGFPGLAAALLTLYPAWDALASLVDGHRSGGIAASRSQAINAIVSLAVAGAIAVTLPDMHRVLAVFGAWAILSGLLQLTAALKRWKTNGAQWAMVLSGAQSALAGAVFVYQASAPAEPTIATVVGYAGFGAFYFLVSALTLSVRIARRKAA
ncbi:MAG: DUF308 domain-containing protein [Alphaproteobacteria bacterium]|nr:MAG: DUF308 domain-containing protein [Alphaproteobacteria bacterium]